MDFALSAQLNEDRERFTAFLADHLRPYLRAWEKEEAIPRSFFRDLGQGGWLGYEQQDGRYVEQSALRQAILMEEMAKLSPGAAVAYLVQMSLGLKGLYLFGTEQQKKDYFARGVDGEALICLASTENAAGSDVAAMSAGAARTSGGWVLSGAKSWTTNGAISDYAIVTAVTDADAPRSRRISMFWLDLNAGGVTRRKLRKRVWIPSDLTRIAMKDVFVPDEALMGERGRGMQQVLEIFTHSRLTIAPLALGTAAGAFDLALDHAGKREIFGRKIFEHQAKAFEIAELYAQLEAARLVVYKSCWTKDATSRYFELEASLAKYLSVEAARRISAWAADLFGAASVVADHPVHKFPMDAWAVSLGEGTQDVQKLVIFRKLMEGSAGRR